VIAVVTRVVHGKEKREPDGDGREEPFTDAGSIVDHAGFWRKTESERVQPAYRGGLSQDPNSQGLPPEHGVKDGRSLRSLFFFFFPPSQSGGEV
jgi:hypothetical protein